MGDAGDLVPTLTDVADNLGVTVEIVDADEWEHGEAMGVCQYEYAADQRPLVKAKARSNEADLAVTLVHEYAHALLHSGVDAERERAKREVEAEAVGYVVGRHFGLDTSGSAFYLAAWQDDNTKTVQDRLGRISSTAETIIKAMVG